jgi:hypothetical protein
VFRLHPSDGREVGPPTQFLVSEEDPDLNEKPTKKNFVDVSGTAERCATSDVTSGLINSRRYIQGGRRRVLNGHHSADAQHRLCRPLKQPNGIAT